MAGQCAPPPKLLQVVFCWPSSHSSKLDHQQHREHPGGNQSTTQAPASTTTILTSSRPLFATTTTAWQNYDINASYRADNFDSLLRANTYDGQHATYTTSDGPNTHHRHVNTDKVDAAQRCPGLGDRQPRHLAPSSPQRNHPPAGSHDLFRKERAPHSLQYNRPALLLDSSAPRKNLYWSTEVCRLSFPSHRPQLTVWEHSVSPSIRLYISWAWTAVQILPLVQIALACMPLFRARDEMTDIALTAAQRKLLGLAPAVATTSPQKDLTFSTPPRYSRTPSIAGSVGSRGSYTHSPLSGRGSPFQNSTAGSPFSPAPLESPLLPKSGSNLFGGGGGAKNRRSSSGSPFSASTSMNLLGDPASPSPAGKRTSVGLNSKWLYEKGRRSSGSAWVH